MAVFAHIMNGQVAEPLFTLPADTQISDCFAPGLVWVDVTAVNPAPGAGWSATQTGSAGTFAAPVAPVVVPATKVPATAFMNRLTQPEQAAIASAAMTQPQMLLWLINMAAAGTIDLSDPAVRAGVNGLVPAVLTSARAAAVLTP